MRTTITISSVELDGDDGVFLTFSDGTNAGYVIEELLSLRPYRDRAEDTSKNPAPVDEPSVLLQSAATEQGLSASLPRRGFLGLGVSRARS